jgi:two-component system cell cycle sensor histidine kinase/response regulator CckA
MAQTLNPIGHRALEWQVLTSTAAGPYGLAVIATGAAFAAKMTLPGVVGPATFILFYPAVLLAAAAGGLGPGLLSTAMSMVLAACWVVPAKSSYHIAGLREATSFVTFATVGMLTSVMAAFFRRARFQVVQLERERTLREAEERARRREEEALRRYQLLADNSRDIILFLRRDDGGIVEANAAATAAYGYTRDELLTLTIRELRASDTWESIERQMGEADARGIRFESIHRRRDGSTLPVEVSSQGATVDGTRLLISVVRDISERKQAEERLAAERERLAVTLESIGDAVIATDEAARIAILNGVAEQLTGWKAEQAIGRSLEEIFHILSEETRQRVENPVARVLREGSVVGLANHTLMVARDGTERPIADSAAPIRDSSGRVSGVVLVFRDQTEERRAELAFRESEERFHQAQKLESIGRLAGGVAHDFNNLLTVILSYADSLNEAVRGGAAASLEELQEIGTAARRARDLTRQLLAFARKQVITPVPLDLNGVVQGSEKLLRRVLGEDVALTVTLAPDLWLTRCDPGQLEQVILNLAVNARDAMPHGGTLTIRTGNESGAALPGAQRPREYVQLTVGDSGVGMSEDVKSHLFEPFFTSKPTGSGTGLGLATVYGIVTQSGGLIRVHSEPGRGSLFELLFPRTLEEPAPDPAPSPTAARGTESILVVEDEPQVRAVTVRALQAAGYQVVAAACPEAALALPPSALAEVRLLLTDVVMPGLDGPSLAEELCRRRPGLRVLYLSGYSQDAISGRGVLAPGVDLLEKPFTASSLLARVRAVLDAA